MFRPASQSDVDAVADGYEALLIEEEKNGTRTNWVRGLYPTRRTAVHAVEKGWLYVWEDTDIVASVIFNQFQAPEYKKIAWSYVVNAEEVYVLHTLCIPPAYERKGYGTKLVHAAEVEAKKAGASAIRMDTWEGNEPARAFYEGLGYRYAGSYPSLLEGVIEEVLVFYEKSLIEKSV